MLTRHYQRRCLVACVRMRVKYNFNELDLTVSYGTDKVLTTFHLTANGEEDQALNLAKRFGKSTLRYCSSV